MSPNVWKIRENGDVFINMLLWCWEQRTARVVMTIMQFVFPASLPLDMLKPRKCHSAFCCLHHPGRLHLKQQPTSSTSLKGKNFLILFTSQSEIVTDVDVNYTFSLFTLEMSRFQKGHFNIEGVSDFLTAFLQKWSYPCLHRIINHG